MKITINDNKTFFDIQEEFCRMFPFLKIEFFSRTSNPENTPGQKPINYNSKTLAEYCTNNKKGCIIITPKMTVSHLDHCFADEYGLSVKVYRNSWRVWLEATITDSWTLEEQNRQGEALSGKVIQNVF